LVIGESGSGKTASLRNFKEDEILIFNVANKPLPFRRRLRTVDNAGYEEIGQVLRKCEYKSYAIDDSQYLMAFELFDRAKENGYNKFAEIALRFRNMLDYIIRKLPDDVIVYFLHHTEITDSGRVKAKTVGKMLDNQLTVEGLFSIVLQCVTDGSTYKFITQSDGYTTAKSPMEMFEREIPNDLKYVDETIREYYKKDEEEQTA